MEFMLPITYICVPLGKTQRRTSVRGVLGDFGFKVTSSLESALLSCCKRICLVSFGQVSPSSLQMLTWHEKVAIIKFFTKLESRAETNIATVVVAEVAHAAVEEVCAPRAAVA